MAHSGALATARKNTAAEALEFLKAWPAGRNRAGNGRLLLRQRGHPEKTRPPADAPGLRLYLPLPPGQLHKGSHPPQVPDHRVNGPALPLSGMPIYPELLHPILLSAPDVGGPDWSPVRLFPNFPDSLWAGRRNLGSLRWELLQVRVYDIRDVVSTTAADGLLECWAVLKIATSSYDQRLCSQ